MTKQQDKYARKNRDLQEFQKELHKFLREKAKHLTEDNPRYKEFDVLPMMKAYVRNPKGKSKALLRLIEEVIGDQTCEKTNAELLETVKPEFPGISLSPSLWSQTRHKSQIKKFQKHIDEKMGDKTINIEKCKSLSDIRRRFKVAYLGKGETKTLKPTVTLVRGTEIVIVNGKHFTAYPKKSKGHEYPCIKFTAKGQTYSLRVDALWRLLKK